MKTIIAYAVKIILVSLIVWLAIKVELFAAPCPKFEPLAPLPVFAKMAPTPKFEPLQQSKPLEPLGHWETRCNGGTCQRVWVPGPKPEAKAPTKKTTTRRRWLR